MDNENLIHIRDIHFPLNEVEQRDWYDGDPIKTTFCDALSVFFPVGERFFIKSVKHFSDRIDDPDFKEEVRRFCIQEALHTREHEAYNAHLASYGYDIEKMEGRVKRALNSMKVPMFQLALTVGIEHLTACLSHIVLNDPKVLEKAHPVYRRLWTWHALEEMEHKGVAFDVFKLATAHFPGWKRYLLRVFAMLVVTVYLHKILLNNFADMLRFRGHSLGLGTWSKLAVVLFVNPGIYRRGFLHYLSFYLPFFHPWKGDDGSLTQKGRECLAQLMKDEESNVSSRV